MSSGDDYHLEPTHDKEDTDEQNGCQMKVTLRIRYRGAEATETNLILRDPNKLKEENN